MNTTKNILSSQKYTALLGLIGSIVMVIPVAFTIDSHFLLGSILISVLNSILGIGFLLYFVIFLLRLYCKKGNIKVANTTLLVTLVLQIVMSVGNLQKNLYSILVFFILVGFFIYFINIFYMKKKIFNNIYFLMISILYFLFAFSSIYQLIGMIDIIPYFYNYYSFLKKEGSIK